VWVVLVTVCAAAVPFYLRFLVALCKECRYTRICYLVRIEPRAAEELLAESDREESRSERAA